MTNAGSFKSHASDKSMVIGVMLNMNRLRVSACHGIRCSPHNSFRRWTETRNKHPPFAGDDRYAGMLHLAAPD